MIRLRIHLAMLLLRAWRKVCVIADNPEQIRWCDQTRTEVYGLKAKS